MKIAIVSYWLLESSLPLAKHISLLGYEIDLYILLPVGGGSSIIDFSKVNKKAGFLDQAIVYETLSENLKKYLGDGISVKVHFFNHYSRSNVIKLYKQAFLFASKINKKNYDTLHLIGHDAPLLYIYRFIRCRNIVHSLHEVTNHESNFSSLNQYPLLRYIVNKKSIKLIFHSNSVRDKFLSIQNEFWGAKNIIRQIQTIPFGLFETYLLFDDVNTKTLKKNDNEFIVLYYGRITKYKGLNYLVEAFRKLQEIDSSIKLIIAGAGEPYFEFNEYDKNITFINKHLSDKEIVELHKATDITICPYTSASQSGITMTSYLFRKPVIATNVGGFVEVIDNMKTGLLIAHSSADEIIEAVLLIKNNSDLLNNMILNIKEKFNKTDSEYSWSKIAFKTLDFYLKN